MAASSSVVIKVKYGDTLRRFNAQFAGNHELNLTMDGLRNKIISFFSFKPDTELVLTYIDEDDDVVTLVDDDDLHDAVKQDLNPLRITVTVDAEKKGPQTSLEVSSSPSDNGVPEILKSLPGPLYETLVKLSADLASKASPSENVQKSSEHVEKSLQNLNNGVSQMMGTVPEPLRESIEKLTADLASKAKLSVDKTKKSASATSELVDRFRKVGMSYMDQLSQPKLGVNSFRTEKGISGKTEGFPKSKPTKENNEVKIQSASGSTIFKSSENSGVDGKPKKWSHQLLKKALSKVDGKDYLTSQTTPVENNAGKGVRSSILSSNVPFIANKSVGWLQTVLNHHAAVGASDPTNPLLFDDAMSGGFGKNAGPFCVPPSPSNLNFSGFYDGYSTAYGCPFSGLGMETGSAASASPLPASKVVGSFKRSVSQNEYSGNIFHRGVRCDGCGVHPITGPRFKSNVKVNYDLCSICFDEMGNDTDYTRIDRPALYKHNMSLKALNEARARGPTFHQLHHKSFKVKSVAAKLDSRFIKDVNIFDGTVMAPATPFTKIWRMKNNGTVVWPEKTQLVWIGGDKLSNELVVEVQIPTAGLKINDEVEVAVNFLSPEHPGSYTSYWRMALPSGQKFGQRIWVLIQVDSSLKDAPPCENGRNLNLNLPPSSMIGSEIINVDLQPIVEDGPTKPLKREQPNTDQDLKFPINDSLLVGNGASSSRPISYPIIDFTDVVLPPVQSVGPTVTYPVQEQIQNASIDVEEKLLKELEEMGFKEVDLNKQMLRMNEYDLGQAVDDLCGVAEWDPILDELQEMGFHDTATNKMLLKKNNGSIKRVVMDLIAGEKIE